mgnify:CR=1 FL=1
MLPYQGIQQRASVRKPDQIICGVWLEMPAMRTGNGRNQIRADLRFLPEGQTVEAKAAFQLMREEVFFSVKAHGIENADDIGCLLRQIHMNLFLRFRG